MTPGLRPQRAFRAKNAPQKRGSGWPMPPKASRQPNAANLRSRFSAAC
jgi:hypothetical protein